MQLYLPIADLPVNVFLVLAMGAAVGFVSGMFGIGVEQNLAESYKWFSLAAAQGDADAATKRDDVAKRLDPQSLAAAKLAIQTFSAEPQPDDAVNVSAPNGGWDSAPQANAKPAPKAVASKKSASAAR